MTKTLALSYAESLVMALQDCPDSYADAIVDEWLETRRTYGPPIAFLMMEADAAMWVDCANQTELRVYLQKILPALGGTSFGINSTKRLLVALWDRLSPQDKAAFLAKVSPPSTKMRRAA